MRAKHVGINFYLREKCELVAGKSKPVCDFVQKINEVNDRLPITTYDLRSKIKRTKNSVKNEEPKAVFRRRFTCKMISRVKRLL